VQHPDNFDNIGFDRAIENRMHRIGNSSLRCLATSMPNMETTNIRQQISAGNRQVSTWIVSDPAHCGREKRAIPVPSFGPEVIFTGSQYRSNVGLRRLGKPIARHV
jgi:hypothetical protein